MPTGKLIEAVVDNYATHKHPKVKAWLKRHPRWTFHFTPTSGSWLNAVKKSSPSDPKAHPARQFPIRWSICRPPSSASYSAEHNAEPKPFVWKASAASILANKLDRLPVSSE